MYDKPAHREYEFTIKEVRYHSVVVEAEDWLAYQNGDISIADLVEYLSAEEYIKTDSEWSVEDVKGF